MLTVTITLLERATVAEDFAPLSTGTADVGAGTVSVTPIVPAAAAGHELEVSVLSTGGSVDFASFVMIPAAPAVDGGPIPRRRARASSAARPCTRPGPARRDARPSSAASWLCVRSARRSRSPDPGSP